MRLVDADALDNMLAAAQTECKRNGGNFRFGVLSNVRENIVELPAIDAIPVEWLKAQINDAIDDNETEFASDIDWLIRKYKNEQEAR